MDVKSRCVCVFVSGKYDHFESMHETIAMDKKKFETVVSHIGWLSKATNKEKYETRRGERDTIKLMPCYKPSYKFIVAQNLSTFAVGIHNYTYTQRGGTLKVLSFCCLRRSFSLSFIFFSFLIHTRVHALKEIK